MKVLQRPVAVAVASSAMLASCLGLTVLSAATAGSAAVTIAAAASPAVCSNATLVEAGKCLPG